MSSWELKSIQHLYKFIKHEIFGYPHSFYPHQHKPGDLVWIKKLRRPGFIHEIDPFSMFWHYEIKLPERSTYWSDEELIGLSIRKRLWKKS